MSLWNGRRFAPESYPLIAAPVRFAVVLLLSAFAGGCAARDTASELCVPNVHTVTPGVLVRGGQPDEPGLRALRDVYGIRTVVNLNDRTAASEAVLARRAGLNYLALPSNALRLEPDKLLAFLKVVDDPGRNGAVYVHCKEGMDRTGAAVAAYRIVDCGWDADRALAELRRHQSLSHTLLFLNLPPFVRGMGTHSAQWKARLGEMPAPEVEHNEPDRGAKPQAAAAAPA